MVRRDSTIFKGQNYFSFGLLFYILIQNYSTMKIIKSIQNRIYEIRGERVILDRDLADLYEVETKVLNQSVKRNIKRFPKDFMFQLTVEE